ncbi:hypothetical protein Pta02_51090 [Planobispora takensis]|uniref:Uncharacterized protein n=1 Tax=Planobispora takensis TaxID=1367882 RepID=A0A8J3WUU6_9ACTN|nr:hypothetical protein Pta02_51090 [Planobispora takensis]
MRSNSPAMRRPAAGAPGPPAELCWENVVIGEHLTVRREFDPPHPTTGHRVAEWHGRLIDNSRWGFSLRGDDGRRQGFFAWSIGPGYRQSVTRSPDPAQKSQRLPAD